MVLGIIKLKIASLKDSVKRMRKSLTRRKYLHIVHLIKDLDPHYTKTFKTNKGEKTVFKMGKIF